MRVKFTNLSLLCEKSNVDKTFEERFINEICFIHRKLLLGSFKIIKNEVQFENFALFGLIGSWVT